MLNFPIHLDSYHIHAFFCGGKLKSFVEYFKHRKTIHYRPNRQPLETTHTKGKKRKNQDAQRNQEPGINTKIVVHK